nr:MAG TPA: hypothetical protein [Caudoviricetes sp.]DAI81733.1 MAG TPA: hypothetical protein [Caudoviricetes sp.]
MQTLSTSPIMFVISRSKVKTSITLMCRSPP